MYSFIDLHLYFCEINVIPYPLVHNRLNEFKICAELGILLPISARFRGLPFCVITNLCVKKFFKLLILFVAKGSMNILKKIYHLN